MTRGSFCFGLGGPRPDSAPPCKGWDTPPSPGIFEFAPVEAKPWNLGTQNKIEVQL